MSLCAPVGSLYPFPQLIRRTRITDQVYPQTDLHQPHPHLSDAHPIRQHIESNDQKSCVRPQAVSGSQLRGTHPLAHRWLARWRGISRSELRSRRKAYKKSARSQMPALGTVAPWGARGSAKHIGAGASDASRRRAAAIMLLIRVPLAASASDRGVGVAQCVSMIEFLRGRSSGSGQGVFVLWSGNLLISTDVGIGRGLSDADSRAPGA